MSRNLGQGLTVISDMRGLKGDNFDEWTSSLQSYISDYDSVFFCLPVIVFSLQFAVTCRQNLMHFLGMARDERSLNDEQRKGKLR